MSDDLEHLDDQIQLYLAALEARAALIAREPDREVVALASERFSERQQQISEREARAKLRAVIAMDRLGLGETERHVVWLLAAVACHRDVSNLVARVSGEDSIDPTAAAIKLVVHGLAPSREALDDFSPMGRLRRLAVVERSDGCATTHERRSTWALSRRMLALLHGDTRLDAELANVARIPESAKSLGDLAIANADEIVEACRSGRRSVVLAGLAGLGRRSALLAAARQQGEVLEIDARALAPAAELRPQLRALARECKLLARVPLIANLDVLDDERLALVGSELVAQLDGLVLATCATKPAIRWDRPTVVVEMGRPSSDELGKLWLRELGQGSESDAEHLASQYPLAPAMIHRAAAAAKARANGDAMTPDDIYAGIRSVLDDRLGAYARRVTVTQSWDDLVLPPDQLAAVTELMARVRRRRTVYEQWGFAAKVGKGLGVAALFSGPPGTGKTMVTALIARDLGLELYQVDLGKVVSKWIGETEKNLAAVFDAAEAGHAIVLFDEADALFGKRTEVRSSNDRHANLETNYLLQRLESFTGVCLLTSNHESHIDPAFQRRLSLHLRFELPGVAERARLWRAMLPPAAPIAPAIDFDGLARRYAMSGGYIRNAALRAAFVAADAEAAITTAHLERAARLEYEGMGKLAIAS